MKLFHKATDERVIATANRIYRTAFIVLDIGILIDIVVQAVSSAQIRWLEFAVFMVANIFSTIQLTRHGMMDDNVYAEADVFPTGHYLRLSLLVGVLLGVIYPVLMYAFGGYWQGLSGNQVFAVGAVTGVFMGGLTAVLLMLAFYVSFAAAKRRRNKEETDTNEGEL